MNGWLCPGCGKAHGPQVMTCPENPSADNRSLKDKIGRGIDRAPPLGDRDRAALPFTSKSSTAGFVTKEPLFN